jgi:membrane protein implicated in regulation of membrane protease activity
VVVLVALVILLIFLLSEVVAEVLKLPDSFLHQIQQMAELIPATVVVTVVSEDFTVVHLQDMLLPALALEDIVAQVALEEIIIQV